MSDAPVTRAMWHQRCHIASCGSIVVFTIFEPEAFPRDPASFGAIMARALSQEGWYFSSGAALLPICGKCWPGTDRTRAEIIENARLRRSILVEQG